MENKRKSKRAKKYIAYVYASILPFSVDTNGDVCFLIGQEQKESGWSGSNKWSDFGGSPDGNSPKVAAAKEAYEETMGLLGSLKSIKLHLYDELMYRSPTGYTFLYPVPYDAKLPTYFKNVFDYFKKCGNKKNSKYVIPSCKEGYFEKQNVKWIKATDLYESVSSDKNKIEIKESDGSITKLTFRSEFIKGLKNADFFKMFSFHKGIPEHINQFVSKIKI